MSAFLVREKTIHKVLFAIAHEMKRSGWFKRQCEKELKIDENTKWQTKLGQKLLDLNQLALSYRYGDEAMELRYKYLPTSCTLIEAYKAIHCWRYQCSEGEVPTKSKLFQFIDNVVLSQLADDIITGMPEYDKAEWG